MKRSGQFVALFGVVFGVAVLAWLARPAANFSMAGVHVGDRASDVLKLWAPDAAEIKDAMGRTWLTTGHIDFNTRARISATGLIVEIIGYEVEKDGARYLTCDRPTELVSTLGRPLKKTPSKSDWGYATVDYWYPGLRVRMVESHPLYAVNLILGDDP